MNMSRTIHVIDDDDLARDVISSLVATLPGVSVSAWDSAERFLTAAQEGAAPGVVLLDLNMPGLSGNEALQAFDHRRLEAGLARKVAHGAIRNTCLYLGIYERRVRSGDWGYWRDAARNPDATGTA